MVLLNLFTMGFLWVVGNFKGADVVNPLESVISNSSNDIYDIVCLWDI